MAIEHFEKLSIRSDPIEVVLSRLRLGLTSPFSITPVLKNALMSFNNCLGCAQEDCFGRLAGFCS